MTTSISLERVVDVDVNINDNFAAIENFGIPLITTATAAGDLATDVVRSFSSLQGVEDYGFSTDSRVYQTALAMLSQADPPSTFKVGMLDLADITASWSALVGADNDFYTVVFANNVGASDAAALIQLNQLLITAGKHAFMDSTETDQRDDYASTTSLAAQLRDVTPSRVALFYKDAPSTTTGTDTGGGTGGGTTPLAPEGTQFTLYDGSAGALGGVPLSGPHEVFQFDKILLKFQSGWNGQTDNDIFEIPSPPADGAYIDIVLNAAILTGNGNNLPLQFSRQVYGPNRTAQSDDGFIEGIFGQDQVLPVQTDFNGGGYSGGVPTAGDLMRITFDAGAGRWLLTDIWEGGDWEDYNNAVTPTGGTGTTTSADTVEQFYAAKAAAYVSGVDYNQPNSHYTLKFKELTGAIPAAVNDAQVQALTGFVPALGNQASAGGFMNSYICMRSRNFVVEGVYTDGSFIDVTTFADWLRATIQRNVLDVYIQNQVVPYDAAGVLLITTAIAAAMSAGLDSGALTEGRTDSNGNVLPAFEISYQDIASVDAALQNQRIAPVFQYCARYSNAIHHVTITGELKIAN